MKKLSVLILAFILCLSFVACAGKPASSAPASSAPASEAAPKLEGSLEEIMDKVLAGVPEGELPMMLPADETNKYTVLDAESSVYFTGVEASEYTEAIAADAAMSAIAHSVCLLRAESSAAAETLAENVKTNANPRKWICVEAEKVIVDRIDDVVILIMTSADLADKLDANFQALAQ